ncbi:MAG: hypothetical protein QNJ91_06460 [Gammaproteobacteria bacterium]|nr:hypothetical protein [Gammaproteobacteria bacterium]
MTTHAAMPAALKAALAAAQAQREGDADPDGVAEWLLRQHGRCEALESLLLVVDRYLRFGMPEHELTEMRVLVEHLREHDLAADHSDEVDSTLPL